MTLTVKQLIDSTSSLGKYWELSGIPALVAYQIRREKPGLLHEVEAALATRLEIVKRFGISQDGQNWTIPPERTEGALAELGPLLSREIELNVTRVPLSALANVTTLSANDFERLAPFIDETR